MFTFTLLTTFLGVTSETSKPDNNINIDTDTITCGTDINNLNKTYEDATCYQVKDMDDLDVYNERGWLEGGIYFIDSSCKGGLNVREACSVEAAAKVNPTRQVSVFFAGPIQVMCLTSEPLISLLTYHNIKLRRIYVKEFAQASGLDHLLTRFAITAGPHPTLYALEILKYIVLHKFDGIYMDLDVMATRPFNDLPISENWVAIEDHQQGKLSSAIFSAGPDKVGREFIESVIRVLKDNNSYWSLRDNFQSRDVLKTALEQQYGAIPFDTSSDGYSYKQQDLLMLYASKFFLPIKCQSSKAYFNSNLTDGNRLAFTHRICSGQTFRDVITEQSAYAQLMRENCPRVYEHFAKAQPK